MFSDFTLSRGSDGTRIFGAGARDTNRVIGGNVAGDAVIEA